MSDILMLIILMLSILNFIIARKKSFKTVSTQVSLSLENEETLREKLDHLEEENIRLEKLLLEQQIVIQLALKRIVVPTDQSSKREEFCNVGPQSRE